MAKIELKGYFEIINPPVKFDGVKGDLWVQDILFRVPAYTDKFGDKQGQDELWPLTVFGDKIQEFNLIGRDAVNEKGILTVFVNAKTWYSKEDTAKKEPKYGLNGIINKVELIP